MKLFALHNGLILQKGTKEVKALQFFFEKKDSTKKELIEQVILQNYNQYYRLAYSYVHNEADAGDIVQDGAYRAIKSSHTLKNPDYVMTWVYRIMLNECFRYLKQPKNVSYEALQEEQGFELGQTEDSYLDVDLQKALDSLGDKDKAIIIMKYFEDKKLEEIAEVLEENLSTVKSRLYRSMKKLQEILSDDIDK